MFYQNTGHSPSARIPFIKELTVNGLGHSFLVIKVIGLHFILNTYIKKSILHTEALLACAFYQSSGGNIIYLLAQHIAVFESPRNERAEELR